MKCKFLIQTNLGRIVLHCLLYKLVVTKELMVKFNKANLSYLKPGKGMSLQQMLIIWIVLVEVLYLLINH